MIFRHDDMTVISCDRIPSARENPRRFPPTWCKPRFTQSIWRPRPSVIAFLRRRRATWRHGKRSAARARHPMASPRPGPVGTGADALDHATDLATERRQRHVAWHRAVFTLPCAVPGAATTFFGSAYTRQPRSLALVLTCRRMPPSSVMGRVVRCVFSRSASEIGKACSREPQVGCAGSNPAPAAPVANLPDFTRAVRTGCALADTRRAPRRGPTSRRGAPTPGGVMQERTLCATPESQPSV